MAVGKEYLLQTQHFYEIIYQLHNVWGIGKSAPVFDQPFLKKKKTEKKKKEEVFLPFLAMREGRVKYAPRSVCVFRYT